MSKKFLSLLAIMVVLVFMQSPLVAKTKLATNSNGAIRMVSATFLSTDKTGCISTEVNISGQLYSGYGQPAIAFLDVLKRNDCKDKTLISGKGQINLLKKDFSFDRQLSNAYLEKKIFIFDTVSQRKKPINFKIKWQGLGKTTHSYPNKYSLQPGKHVVETKKICRNSRDADAFGKIIILGKRHKFNHADDATLTLLERPNLTSGISSKTLIPEYNDDPVEENIN